MVAPDEQRGVRGGGDGVQPGQVQRRRDHGAAPRHRQRHAHQPRAHRLLADQLAQPQVPLGPGAQPDHVCLCYGTWPVKNTFNPEYNPSRNVVFYTRYTGQSDLFIR